MSINQVKYSLVILFIGVFSLQSKAQWENDTTVFGSDIHALTIVNEDVYFFSNAGFYTYNLDQEKLSQIKGIPDAHFIGFKKGNQRPQMLVFEEGLVVCGFADSLFYYDFQTKALSYFFYPHKSFKNIVRIGISQLKIGTQLVASYFTLDRNTDLRTYHIVKCEPGSGAVWTKVLEREILADNLFPYNGSLKFLNEKVFILGDSISIVNMDNGSISLGLTKQGLPVGVNVGNLYWDGISFFTLIRNPGRLNENPYDLFSYDGLYWRDIAENAYLNDRDTLRELFTFSISEETGINGFLYKIGTYLQNRSIMKTVDGGVTWEENYLDGFHKNTKIRALVPNNEEWFLLSSQLGFYKTDDNGKSINVHYNLINEIEGLDLVSNHDYSELFLVSSNGLLKRKSNESWNYESKFEQFYKPAYANNEYVFLRHGNGFSNEGYRKRIGGAWEGYPNPINQTINPATKFFGFGKNSKIIFQLYFTIYDDIVLSRKNFQRSSDHGNTWVELKEYLPLDTNETYASKDFDVNLIDERVYLQAKDKVFFSADFGLTWSPCEEGLPKNSEIQFGLLEFEGQIVIANKLYGFKNLGDYELLGWDADLLKWTRADTVPLLPKKIENFGLPASFIYKNDEIFVKQDASSTWLPVSGGLPDLNIEITGMARLEDSLFLSTNGFGVYRMAISDVPGFGKDTVSTTFNPINAFDFKVFPNPSTGNIGLELMPHSAPLFAEVIDLSGKSLIHSIIEAQTASFLIPIENLKPGVYFLKVSDRESIFQTKKIIVY